jgi:hypothetical protein
MLKILLNAGKSPNLEIVYDLFLILLLIIYVKITMTWRKPAGVRSIHTSEASQRLHAGDLEKNKYNVNNYSYSLNTHHYPLSGFKQCGLLLYSGLICGPHTKSNLFTRGFSNTSDLSPYYVTGFSDGESCFHVSLLKSKGYKVGYQVRAIFTLQLHTKDLLLLSNIQSFFSGVGVITKKSTVKAAIYSVQSLKEITEVIVPHFDKYPLLTKKKADFILFKQVIELMNNGEHLTVEGLVKIVNIKATMNKGLSEQLKKQFIDVVPVQKPIIEINITDVSNHF